MRIKLWMWAIIVAIIMLVLLGMMITVKLIWDLSWWFVGGLLIFEAIIGIFIIIGVVVVKFRQIKPKKERKTSKQAQEEVIEALKYDDDNPDNFIVDTKYFIMEGERGHARTPLVQFKGRGHDTNTRIDVIVNLDSPKLEYSKIINGTELQIKEIKKQMAEYPETEITETTTTGVDDFGRPKEQKVVKKVSEREKQEIIAKEEADKSGKL